MIRRRVTLRGRLLEALLVELGHPIAIAVATSRAELPPHPLDSHGDAGVNGAHHDLLGNSVQRFHAGAALAVGVEGADLLGETGEAGDVVRAKAAEFAGAHDVSQTDLFNAAWIHLGVARQERAQHG